MRSDVEIPPGGWYPRDGVVVPLEGNPDGNLARLTCSEPDGTLRDTPRWDIYFDG